MPKYKVSFTVAKPLDMTEQQLDELVRKAATTSTCVVLSAGPGTVLVEAAAGTVQEIEDSVRAAFKEGGCHVLDLTIKPV